MSKENVRLFYEELAKNKVLQEKFNLVGKKFESKKPDEAQLDLVYQNEVIPLAKAAGFDFTLVEFKKYAKEMSKPKTGELTDEELGAVAGGCFWTGGSGCGSAGTFDDGICYGNIGMHWGGN